MPRGKKKVEAESPEIKSPATKTTTNQPATTPRKPYPTYVTAQKIREKSAPRFERIGSESWRTGPVKSTKQKEEKRLRSS